MLRGMLAPSQQADLQVLAGGFQPGHACLVIFFFHLSGSSRGGFVPCCLRLGCPHAGRTRGEHVDMEPGCFPASQENAHNVW